jgi:7-carboxy-7-deazaguanine synthase
MENMGLAINSIYRATEGEGIFIGSPQVFVRFQGCAVGCINCDSKDTWDFPLEPTLKLDEALATVAEQAGPLKRVSVTGGDPLHPKNVPGVLALVKELKASGNWINIEAAGTRILPEIFDLVDFISFDFKTPSTGVKTRFSLLKDMAMNYSNKFQIKAVIESPEDFNATLAAKKEVFGEGFVPWILTPAYNLGEEFPKMRFQEIVDLNELSGGHFRVIGQQHKWLHGPDKKQI